MSFSDERSRCEQELDTYYATYPTDFSALEHELHDISANHPEWLPIERKIMGYELIGERCPVKIFRHFPFYFELDTGKPRTDLGGVGLGHWLKNEPFGRQLWQQGEQWWQPCAQNGLSEGWLVLDDNHHCIGIDNVFRCGLNGLIQAAELRLPTVHTAKERTFLLGVIAGNRALITVANRMATMAEQMLFHEVDPIIRHRLAHIADTARRVPAEPPETLYEALNTMLFMREVTQQIEGNGNSGFGHLDRQLIHYYKRDLAEGRITRAEAKDLIGFFLSFSDIRFGMRHAPGDHVGTNTTVVIGGCDANGTVVFNEITRMIIECYAELRLVDPKLNARFSKQHPPEYFQLLAQLITIGTNVLALFNDDVIIDANVKMGKAIEDARLYVGVGCQENLLLNTEVNSRATMYLNVAAVFRMGLLPEEWSWFADRENIAITSYAGSCTFEDLYGIFLSNLKAVVDAHIDQRNRTEGEGSRYNPCPLHSSTVSDCLVRALDMMEGGARYSNGSVSLVGVGTLIDSLIAVQTAVYDQHILSLPQLKSLLSSNFVGEEAMRQYLVRRIPKFGQENDFVRTVSARVFSDLARIASGKENTRGGRYEASLFSFRSFTSLGTRTGATPDGRRAGEYLSPGMSPSVLAFGEHCGITQLLASVEPLDLTQYPVVAVLDVKLPVLRDGDYQDILIAVLKQFLNVGGSVLQLNYVDAAMLLEAKKHPEQHPDLVVRVSGYSSYFTKLPEKIQDEIIERTQVSM